MAKYYEPILPKNVDPIAAVFGQSTNAPGTITEHLFEGGKLVGHASWREVDIPLSEFDDSFLLGKPSGSTLDAADALKIAIALLAVVGLAVGVVVATPHIVRWWKAKFVPFVKIKVFRKAKSQAIKISNAIPRLRVLVETKSKNPSTAVARSTNAKPVTMTLEEWQRHVSTMILAGAIAENEWQLLSSAQIAGNDLGELQQAMGQIEPSQFADAVNQLLGTKQAHPLQGVSEPMAISPRSPKATGDVSMT